MLDERWITNAPSAEAGFLASPTGAATGVLAESEDFPHSVEALDRVLRRLRGVSDESRFDRVSTVANPGTGHVTAGFTAVAKRTGHRNGPPVYPRKPAPSVDNQ